MKKLVVVIVNYNVKHYVEQCLMSVQKASQGLDVDVYVVDNHSKDGSVEYLKKRFPTVRIISNNNNLGFSRANNIAIRQSDSEYVLLLNPDTIVGESTLKASVSFLDSHDAAGAVGVCMLQDNGIKARESRRGLPTPLVAFYKMCGLCERYPQSKRFGHYYMSDLSWDKPGQIEVVSGAYFMIRRSALNEIGLLDEDFFMYGEDIDLSYRLLKNGYQNWYLPEKILHYKGESTQKTSFRYVHVFYEAMLIFFRKHYANSSWLLTIPIKLAIYTKALSALVSLQIHRARRSLGFIDRSQHKSTHYVLIGSEETLADCRRIIDQYALEVEYIEGTSKSLPHGHTTVDLPKDRPLCVVYDVSSYAYSDILTLFSLKSENEVCIGTYDPMTKVIVTPQTILT